METLALIKASWSFSDPQIENEFKISNSNVVFHDYTHFYFFNV